MRYYGMTAAALLAASGQAESVKMQGRMPATRTVSIQYSISIAVERRFMALGQQCKSYIARVASLVRLASHS